MNDSNFFQGGQLNPVPVSRGGTGSTTAGGAQTALGLGTMSTQAANSVAITGGSITNITDLAIADGGTGASTAPNARTALGVGTGDSPTFASVNATNGKFTGTVTGTGGASYGSVAPITVYVKSATVLTAATPADIATIVIPVGITRYRVSGLSSQITIGGNAIYAETAAGTLAGASFILRDAASGAGNALTTSALGPVTAGTFNSVAVSAGSQVFTSATLYLNQTANSANAGTVSFYVTIYPIP